MAVIALDVETNAKDVRYDPLFRVLGVSYAMSNSEDKGYIALGHSGIDGRVFSIRLRSLRRLLESAESYVFHNAKFDLQCFERLGINLYDSQWYDTMLMQHMLDENLPSKSLDYLGKHYFNVGKEVSEEFENFLKCFGWEFVPEWMIRDYAIQDAVLTLNLFNRLMPEFISQGFA
jgi:DNA polymerase I-like protein with 3'-5' exonuclease and polymerase domains